MFRCFCPTQPSGDQIKSLLLYYMILIIHQYHCIFVLCVRIEYDLQNFMMSTSNNACEHTPPRAEKDEQVNAKWWIDTTRLFSARKQSFGLQPRRYHVNPLIKCMLFNPRCNEETRTIKAVPIFVWNFDPISWKNYQIWSNFRQTEN